MAYAQYQEHKYYTDLSEYDRRFFETSNIIFKIKSKNEGDPDIKLIANINHFLNSRSQIINSVNGDIISGCHYYITCNYKNFKRFMNNIRTVESCIIQNCIFTINYGGVNICTDFDNIKGFIYPDYIESYKEQLDNMMNLWIEPVSPQIKNKCQQPNHIKNIGLTKNQLLMYSKCISKENILFGKLSDVKCDDFLPTTGYLNPEFPSLDCNLDNFTAICSKRGTGKPLVALALSKHQTTLSKFADIDINIIIVEKSIIPKWNTYLNKYYQEDYLVLNNIRDLQKLIYSIPNKKDHYYLKNKQVSNVLIYILDEYHKSLFGGVDTPGNRKIFIQTCKKNISLSRSIEKLKINVSDIFDYLDNQGNLQIQELKKYSVILTDVTNYTKLAMHLILNNLKITRLFIDCIDNTTSWNLSNIPTVKAVKHYRILSNMRTFLYMNGNEFYYPDEKGQPIKSMKAPPVNKYGQTKPFNYISNAIQKYIIPNINTTEYNYQLKALKTFAENIFVFTNPEYNFKIDTYLVPCVDSQNNIFEEQIFNNVIKYITERDIDQAIKIINLPSRKFADIEEKSTVLYNINIAEIKTQISELQKNTDNNLEKITTLEKKIRDIENVKMDLYDRLHITECIICMCDLKHSVVLECCKNVICFECIMTSLLNRSHCPVCRTNISIITDLTLVSNDNFDSSQCFDTYNKIIDSPDIKINMLSRILKYIKNINKSNGVPNKIIIDLGVLVELREYSVCIESNVDKITSLDIKKILIDNNLRFGWCFKFDISNFISEDLIEILITNSQTEMSWQNIPNTTDIIKIGYMNDFVENCIMGSVGGIDRKMPLRIWQLENIQQN